VSIEPETHAQFDRLARLHRGLVERAQAADGTCVAAVLNLGAATLLHAELETLFLRARSRFLDPAVVEELAADHDRLAQGLGLLEQLWRDDPASPDLVPLAAAVHQHLRGHVERDERALYQPLARLGLATVGDAGVIDPAHAAAPRRGSPC
jgi:uncharacterized protein (DUF2236 family)